MRKSYLILLSVVSLLVINPSICVYSEPELETIYNLTYGGKNQDIAYSVVETDNGFLLVGSTMSYGAGDSDVWLLKIDQEGTPLWNRTYGTSALEQGLYLTQTYDNNYLIAGRTNNNEDNFDLLLLKVTPYGDIIWNKTMGGTGDDWMWHTEKTGDDAFVLVGRTNSYGAGLNDYWLIKIDENGELLWNTTLGGVEDERGRTVYPLEDNGLLVLGWSGTYTQGGLDFWLVETDQYGEIRWNSSYGGLEADRGSAIEVSDNGYVLAGSTNSFSEGGSDGYFLELDSERNMIWNKTYGGDGRDSIHEILSSEDDEYLLAGYTESFGAGGRDIWVILTDGVGNSLLEKTFGGPENERFSFSIKTENGDFLIGGSTSTNGDEDFLVLRLRTVKPTPDPLPANLVYTSLSVDPPEIELGESVTITFSIENTGEMMGSEEIELIVNGLVSETGTITLASGERKAETFSFTPVTTGTIEVKIGTLEGSFTVTEVESTNDGIPGFPMWSLLVGIILTSVLFYSKKVIHTFYQKF